MGKPTKPLFAWKCRQERRGADFKAFFANSPRGQSKREEERQLEVRGHLRLKTTDNNDESAKTYHTRSSSISVRLRRTEGPRPERSITATDEWCASTRLICVCSFLAHTTH